MPRFDPFPGLRFDPALVDLDDVTAPPYDVIDADDRRRLLARSDHNVVRIDLPNPDGRVDPGPYSDAANLMATWLDQGVLRRDEPSFYGYRMDYYDKSGETRHTTGVLGALELSAPGEGAILPHEHTTKKAKSDRLELLRATDANLSAVWGLSPVTGLSELIEASNGERHTWADDDGIRHTYWVIDEPDLQEGIASAVGTDAVVIADGHHRYETALAYRDERRAAGTQADGAESTMMWIVELADEQLSVLPIHRLLCGMDAGFDYREAFSPFFEFSPAGRVGEDVLDRMERLGCLTLVERSGAWFLTPKTAAFDGVPDLDSSRLDAARNRLPGHEIVFEHNIDKVLGAVRSGDAQAGVLLRPATVQAILAITDGGERMPPKTTFFNPKPKTGVVLRPL